MAQYDLTTQVNELRALGTTTTELEQHFGDRLTLTPSSVYAWNRATLEAFETFAAEVHRKAALNQGSRVEFRRHDGTWVLWGANLTPGQVVTVTKKDGTTTQETVGAVQTTQGDMVGALIGTPAPTAAPVAAAETTPSAFAGMPNRGTPDEIRAALTRALGTDADTYDIRSIISEVYRPFAKGRLLALDVDRSAIAGIVSNNHAN